MNQDPLFRRDTLNFFKSTLDVKRSAPARAVPRDLSMNLYNFIDLGML